MSFRQLSKVLEKATIEQRYKIMIEYVSPEYWGVFMELFIEPMKSGIKVITTNNQEYSGTKDKERRRCPCFGL